jgi:hypothetical protein
MSDSHLYSYGVIEDDGDFDLDLTDDGVEGADEAYAVSHGPLAAVVTDIETMEPERTDENVRAHDDVLQEILVEGERTVVPMRFGMTFKNARSLKSVLRGGRRAFTKAQREIDGSVEMGVKLVVDEEADPDRAAVAEDTADRLRAVSEEEAENDLFSDRLVFNRSYLVDRDDREAFDEAVDEIDEAWGEELTVQYTGPWAPYNFVDIEIGAKG